MYVYRNRAAACPQTLFLIWCMGAGELPTRTHIKLGQAAVSVKLLLPRALTRAA